MGLDMPLEPSEAEEVMERGYLERQLVRERSAAYSEQSRRLRSGDQRLSGYIRRTVAAAPELNSEQRDRIATLFGVKPETTPREETEAERIARREEADRLRRLDALNRRIRDVSECAYCGVPLAGHRDIKHLFEAKELP